MAHRVEWRHPLGVVTLAFFYLGATTFARRLFPEHTGIAQPCAGLATLAWLIAALKLRLFPIGRERAPGSPFSFLQAAIEAVAFFVLLLVVMVSTFGVTRRGLAIAAIAALVVGIYTGTPRKPPAPTLVFKGKDDSG